MRSRGSERFGRARKKLKAKVHSGGETSADLRRLSQKWQASWRTSEIPKEQRLRTVILRSINGSVLEVQNRVADKNMPE
jgi:hypothetical protein